MELLLTRHPNAELLKGANFWHTPPVVSQLLRLLLCVGLLAVIHSCQCIAGPLYLSGWHVHDWVCQETPRPNSPLLDSAWFLCLLLACGCFALAMRWSCPELDVNEGIVRHFLLARSLGCTDQMEYIWALLMALVAHGVCRGNNAEGGLAE